MGGPPSPERQNKLVSQHERIQAREARVLAKQASVRVPPEPSPVLPVLGHHGYMRQNQGTQAGFLSATLTVSSLGHLIYVGGDMLQPEKGRPQKEGWKEKEGHTLKGPVPCCVLTPREGSQTAAHAPEHSYAHAPEHSYAQPNDQQVGLEGDPASVLKVPKMMMAGECKRN